MVTLQHLRGHRASRWLVMALAIVVLNLSIDPPDREAPGMPEDLSVNDIESIGELVLEQWLGLVDVFPEQDESDQDSPTAKKSIDYRCTAWWPSLADRMGKGVVEMTYPFADHFTAQYEPEPRVPPPWA
jgi:hypothetical protein